MKFCRVLEPGDLSLPPLLSPNLDIPAAATDVHGGAWAVDVFARRSQPRQRQPPPRLRRREAQVGRLCPYGLRRRRLRRRFTQHSDAKGRAVLRAAPRVRPRQQLELRQGAVAPAALSAAVCSAGLRLEAPVLREDDFGGQDLGLPGEFERYGAIDTRADSSDRWNSRQ